MYGPAILARTLSVPAKTGKNNEAWQYHSRGDRHSKVACWSILFDLLNTSSLLRQQIKKGSVAFGINHEMTDFKQNRAKNLDLVLCVPATSGVVKPVSFDSLVGRYGIELSKDEEQVLTTLPALQRAPVGQVLVAIEAKACMTAHVKSIPRLFDELNSSHQTVHGASSQVVAGGFVMINCSDTFVSPGRVGYCPNCGHRVSPVNKHTQPGDARRVVDKVKELPRRSNVQGDGFDAVGIVCIDCKNDGTKVSLVSATPAPPERDIFHYDQMVLRLASLYDSRFPRA